jgi:hypothetical protein
VTGSVLGMFKAMPTVRLAIVTGEAAISKPVSASYGYEEATGDVLMRVAESAAGELEPNTITIMLSDDAPSGAASALLSDAVTGTVLARLNGLEIAVLH